MKYKNFCSLFDETEYDFAVFTTFNFDHVFFENRILKSYALDEALRILVLIDYGQYCRLTKAEVLPKKLNARYLLLPIHQKTGVFHPKLHLFSNNSEARIYCGSANLTQTGCTHNLELMNDIIIKFETTHVSFKYMQILKAAIDFYKLTVAVDNSPPFEIAKRWLNEIESSLPGPNPATDDSISLVHNLSHSFWDRIVGYIGKQQPTRITIISPYYDDDLSLLKRISRNWPECNLEVYAQSRTCNLRPELLKKLPKLTLYTIEDSSKLRRLHAKLVNIQLEHNSICLTGSPNCTVAAFDSLNVETALIFKGEKPISIESLFDKQVIREQIKLSDFVYGLIDPPEPLKLENESECLILNTAILDCQGKIKINYTVTYPEPLESLYVALKLSGEKEPFKTILLNPVNVSDFEIVNSLEHQIISQIQSSVFCTLVGKSLGKQILGGSCWLIQESKLHHEKSNITQQKAKENEIRASGKHLNEYLDHLGTTDGYQSVIEFLKTINIKYDDSSSHRAGVGFGYGAHDPTRPDTPPDWLYNFLGEQRGNLEEAIHDFVQRHQSKVLRRHVNRGNINGTKNFLDVFITCIKLMHKYCICGIVTKPRFVGWMIENIELLEQFIMALCSNLNNEFSILKKSFDDHCTLGHLYAALFVTQMIRKEYEPTPTNATTLLSSTAKAIEGVREQTGLPRPNVCTIMNAIEEYEILKNNERGLWQEELSGKAYVNTLTTSANNKGTTKENIFISFDF